MIHIEQLFGTYRAKKQTIMSYILRHINKFLHLIYHRHDLVCLISLRHINKFLHFVYRRRDLVCFHVELEFVYLVEVFAADGTVRVRCSSVGAADMTVMGSMRRKHLTTVLALKYISISYYTEKPGACVIKVKKYREHELLHCYMG